MTSGAQAIVTACEAFLCRALTAQERLLCEEMNLNWFSAAVVRRVQSLGDKRISRDFNLIYVPIKKGIMRGASRRIAFVGMTGVLKRLYQHFEPWLGRDMQATELEVLVSMASSGVTLEEVKAACSVAERRGARHVSYVRAVIDGNRNAVTAKRTYKDASKLVHKAPEGPQVPRVDVVRKRWSETLAKEEQRRMDEATQAQLDRERGGAAS